MQIWTRMLSALMGTNICGFSKTYGTRQVKAGSNQCLRRNWMARGLKVNCELPPNILVNNDFAQIQFKKKKKTDRWTIWFNHSKTFFHATPKSAINSSNPVTSRTMTSSPRQSPASQVDDPCLTSPSRAAHTNHLHRCPHSVLALSSSTRRRQEGIHPTWSTSWDRILPEVYGSQKITMRELVGTAAVGFRDWLQL